jgi:hypothetical protein
LAFFVARAGQKKLTPWTQDVYPEHMGGINKGTTLDWPEKFPTKTGFPD